MKGLFTTHRTCMASEACEAVQISARVKRVLVSEISVTVVILDSVFV